MKSLQILKSGLLQAKFGDLPKKRGGKIVRLYHRLQQNISVKLHLAIWFDALHHMKSKNVCEMHCEQV